MEFQPETQTRLTWSKGLREKYLGDSESTDGEMVTTESPEAKTVAYIADEGFKIIRDRCLESEFLITAERSGWRGVIAFANRVGIGLWCFLPGEDVKLISENQRVSCG